MKKLLIILFILTIFVNNTCAQFLLTSSGSTIDSEAGDTYYIDPGGNNGDDGGIGDPWLTLTYACSQVSGVGDIIHVNAGTYVEDTQSVLDVGVSIEGEGATSIIESDIAGAYIMANITILLSSASEGTDGNQSISYIKMDGNSLTATGAISVIARKNVHIHHCEVIDFFSQGVMFAGVVDNEDPEPTTYATGNKFYDNIVTNCADYYGNGNLTVGGQEGILIYNNTLVQEDRGVGANGYVISFTGTGWYKGMKIYNNTITKPPYDGSTWDFAIELWNCRGGIEIYDNDIQGSIDIGGNTSITNDAGGYGFAMKIHDNTIGQPVLRDDEEVGIHIERGHTGGLYIYNNLIQNTSTALRMYQGDGDTFEDIYVYYNIIDGIGISGEAASGNAIAWGTIDEENITYDNINFLNNVIRTSGDNRAYSGLRFTFKGDATNLTIRNNIIEGFVAYPIYCENSTIDIMSVENNIFYDNDASDNPTYSGCTITNKTEQNNIIDNPDFTSATNFHLQTGSPGLNAGLDLGLSTDYEDVEVDASPNIGAYETIEDP